jgi:putative ABC transport system permease protein
MWNLALKGVFRRRFRALLIIGALAVPVALLLSLSSLGSSYERSLRAELDQMGVQLMLVPLGCPYDAAARVVKGQALDNTLPQSALTEVRADPAVALAAPLLITALPRAGEKRVDLWVGLDEAGRALKPWWKVQSGSDWFGSDDSAILGSEAGAIEMREPGDKLFNPEANRTLRVDGILARSGTADDNLLFVPLRTAQLMFGQRDRLTAIAIRLHQPDLLREATRRLQEIPGAQVVTLTEMMGVFLNLVGSVRMLLQAITLLAVSVAALGVFNTMLAAVLERADELAVMRAIGASRAQLFSLVTLESSLIAMAAASGGLLLSAGLGPALEGAIRSLLPMAPSGLLGRLTGVGIAEALLLCLPVGVLAGLYPAWRASQIEPAKAVKLE